jgi:Raf kinase inhibitor-like YbhB/YbcL family protein
MARKYGMDAVLRSPETDIPGVQTPPEIDPAKRQRFALSSESFEDGGVIPQRLAMDEGVSPQLSWTNVPKNTDRFVIIMDDPDAKPSVGHTFVHWIALLPGDRESIEEGASASGWTDEAKALSGDVISTAYKGPRPPSGRHRYHIAVYALKDSFSNQEFEDLATSEMANDNRSYTRAHFESTYGPHILASAEITGVYEARPN